MFSFPTDDHKNRALIKIDESSWSKPQSFDAIGSGYDVTLQSPTGRSEMHVGIKVEEGEGKVSCYTRLIWDIAANRVTV